MSQRISIPFQPFYLPMAFFVPPTHLIVHAQFNLLFQVSIL
jgi:hypothetical protein